MPAKSHTHRYSKVIIGDKKRHVMRCTLDGCTHILYDPKLAIYRKSICWNCGDTFELGPRDLKLKPTCPKHKTPVVNDKRIDKAVDDLLNTFADPNTLLKALERKN